MKNIILRTARNTKPLIIEDVSAFKVDNGVLLIERNGELIAVFADWFACGYTGIVCQR